jgi:hypothetical protein
MKIGAVFNDVTRVETEILVAPVWSDVRPPRGLAGRADWYLGGFVSRLIRAGTVRGTPGETTLVAVQGKLLAPRLLLLGCGPRGPVGAAALGEHLRHAAAVVRDLGLATVGLEVPPADVRTSLRSLVGEVGEAFAGVAAAEDGEVQILAGTEEECESWRKAIRESFPRGHRGGSPLRPSAR